MAATKTYYCQTRWNFTKFPYDWLAYDPELVYTRGMDKVTQGESRIDEYDRDILDWLVPTLQCDEVEILQDRMKGDDLKSYIYVLHQRDCPEN